MKLGILLPGKRPDDIAPRLAQARDAGFSLCQLNLHQGGFTRADLVSIADALVDQGIRPVAIGCYVNPLRPDAPLPMGAARADLDLLLQCLDIIGARRIVFWSGTYAETLHDEHSDNHTEEALEELRAFLTDVVRVTRARHYFLTLEPWHTHVLNSERRMREFYDSLEPAVAERVRYVLDAVALIPPERYPERDAAAEAVCRSIGDAAGVVHLRDLIMPPDGDPAIPGPGQGTLDYARYLEAIHRYAAPDAPAVIRNVPPAHFAAVRDFMLLQNDRWELV